MSTRFHAFICLSLVLLISGNLAVDIKVFEKENAESTRSRRAISEHNLHKRAVDVCNAEVTGISKLDNGRNKVMCQMNAATWFAQLMPTCVHLLLRKDFCFDNTIVYFISDCIFLQSCVLGITCNFNADVD